MSRKHNKVVTKYAFLISLFHTDYRLDVGRETYQRDDQIIHTNQEMVSRYLGQTE